MGPEKYHIGPRGIAKRREHQKNAINQGHRKPGLWENGKKIKWLDNDNDQQ